MGLFSILTLTVILAALLVVYLEATGRFLGNHGSVEPTRVQADPTGLPEIEAFLQEEFIRKPRAQLKSGASRLDLTRSKRAMFDALGEGRDFGDATFHRADVTDTLSSEWTTVPESDPARRLLYLHGGAFSVGSAKSHRPITAALAQAMNASVFAPDYRLMPEHPRIASAEDARAAYRWMLSNGPTGASDAREVYVGGDSAGGSLTLHILQWARDEGLRQANAATVFSPSTDYTLTSRTVQSNFPTDTMLQPAFKPFKDLPRPVLAAGLWKLNGMRPSHPVASPLFGDLKDLPPTLIQVSETEILLDDARRYAAKAVAQGSEVELEEWCASSPGAPLPHVWHIFDQELPAAREAVKRAGEWMLTHTD